MHGRQTFIIHTGALITCFILCLTLSGPAGADDERAAKRRFDRGRFEYEDGNYEDALEFLQEAVKLDPSKIEYRFHLGLTYESLERWDDAIDTYEEILQLDSNDTRTLLQLSVVKGRLGKYEDALHALERAAAIAPDDPSIRFNLGLLQLQVVQYEAAASSFDWVQKESGELRQAALYHLGLTYFKQKRYDESRQTMARTVELDPSAPYGQSAQSFLDQMNAMIRAERPWYVTASVSGNYDDNVALEPLQGLGLAPTGPALDKADYFMYFSVGGGFRTVQKERYEVGVTATYNQTEYDDLTRNNIKWPVLGLYVNWFSQPFSLRFNYNFSYYWVGTDNESRLRMNEVLATFSFAEGERFRTEIQGLFQDKVYLDEFTPDATRYSAGLLQFFLFQGGRKSIRAGYTYTFENSDPNYYYSEILAGVNADLIWDFGMDIAVRRRWTQFDSQPELFGDVRRDDETWYVDAQLFRQLGDYFRLSFFYAYTDNDSNIKRVVDGLEIFDFRRNVFSLILSATF